MDPRVEAVYLYLLTKGPFGFDARTLEYLDKYRIPNSFNAMMYLNRNRIYVSDGYES